MGTKGTGGGGGVALNGYHGYQVKCTNLCFTLLVCVCSIKWVPRVPSVQITLFVSVCVRECGWERFKGTMGTKCSFKSLSEYVCGVKWVPRYQVYCAVLVQYLCLCSVKRVPRVPSVLLSAYTLLVCVCVRVCV